MRFEGSYAQEGDRERGRKKNSEKPESLSTEMKVKVRLLKEFQREVGVGRDKRDRILGDGRKSNSRR